MKGFQTPAQFDTAASTISFVLGVANLLIYSSIAINWHRYVLLDEIPAGWSRMRLDSLTWRYFFNLIGNVILIFLMSFVLFIPVGILMGLMGGMRTEIHGLPAFVIITLSLPLVAFVFVAFYRISVKLPSIALGRHDFGIRDAWKVTAGNFWPLLGLIVLFFICIIFVLLAMLLATFILVNFGVFWPFHILSSSGLGQLDRDNPRSNTTHQPLWIFC